MTRSRICRTGLSAWSDSSAHWQTRRPSRWRCFSWTSTTSSSPTTVWGTKRGTGCSSQWPGDTLARLGGDEFTILLERINSVADAVGVADRIAAALRAPFGGGGQDVFITASMGAALNGPLMKKPSDLLRAADIAMYRAKANGKGRCAVFDGGMAAAAMERLELETDLRRAAERGEFRVHYQPIVQLATGLITEAEALVRWEHPQHGLVPPLRFIPLAEETGLIVPIGQWILEEACRQTRAWHAQWPARPPLVMSVNLSARQFQQTDLLQVITDALQHSGLAARYLKLEITESVAMRDAQSTIETLRELTHLGVRLAIDDFGTGYSSLAYLNQFPIDTLKIDRSFVDKLADGPEHVAVVRTIVALAKALDLRVTGEGIETAEQALQLEALGCDLGQGYLFSKPQPHEAFSALLAKSAWSLTFRSLIRVRGARTRSLYQLLAQCGRPEKGQCRIQRQVDRERPAIGRTVAPAGRPDLRTHRNRRLRRRSGRGDR